MRSNRAPTLREVSERSGYSIATVHRVMRNNPNVSEGARVRILEAINSFTHSIAVTDRKATHDRLIGVVIKDIENPFFARLAKQIEWTLRNRDYTMILLQSNSDQSQELFLSELLMAIGVGGVLITAVSSRSPVFKELKGARIPFMALDCRAEDHDVDWISSDNYRGAYMATSYLVELGHRQVMFIRGENAQPGLERYEGYRQALADHEIEVKSQLVVGFEGSEDGGAEAISRFVLKHGMENLPTAIFAVNDPAAIGAMSQLQAMKVKVPEDISVIGYDNIDAGRHLYVPLTTIDQSEFHMGETAANQLIDKLENSEHSDVRRILVGPKLVERASCAGPAGT